MKNFRFLPPFLVFSIGAVSLYSRNREIIVKISNFNRKGYRKWLNGSDELVSPANAGRPPNDWTDWIQADAKFVEYWMNGELILQLMRTDL